MISDEQIRTVLLSVWDPLSVGDNQNLRGEYDEFIPKVRAELSEGATQSELAGTLLAIERELGHFDWDGSAAVAAAGALLELYNRSR